MRHRHHPNPRRQRWPPRPAPSPDSCSNKAADLANLYDYSIRDDYCGRGMYGSTCAGIDLDSGQDAFRFLMALSALTVEREFNDDPDGVDPSSVAMELAERVTTDSMGRGVIVYFPGYQFAD